MIYNCFLIIIASILSAIGKRSIITTAEIKVPAVMRGQKIYRHIYLCHLIFIIIPNKSRYFIAADNAY